MGNQGGKALKWLPAHSNSERSDNSKIALMADKHSIMNDQISLKEYVDPFTGAPVKQGK